MCLAWSGGPMNAHTETILDFTRTSRWITSAVMTFIGPSYSILLRTGIQESGSSPIQNGGEFWWCSLWTYHPTALVWLWFWWIRFYGACLGASVIGISLCIQVRATGQPFTLIPAPWFPDQPARTKYHADGKGVYSLEKPLSQTADGLRK